MLCFARELAQLRADRPLSCAAPPGWTLDMEVGRRPPSLLTRSARLACTLTLSPDSTCTANNQTCNCTQTIGNVKISQENNGQTISNLIQLKELIYIYSQGRGSRAIPSIYLFPAAQMLYTNQTDSKTKNQTWHKKTSLMQTDKEKHTHRPPIHRHRALPGLDPPPGPRLDHDHRRPAPRAPPRSARHRPCERPC